MKRIRPLLLLSLALACVLAPVAWAAASGAAPAKSDSSPGAPVARALSTVTGVAISPLLGTSALGAYQWASAKDEAARAKLAWYAQPKFWLPALLVVALCAAKDSFGTVVPAPLKKPLDVLEVAENKLSGLVAAGAVVPFAMDSFSKLVLNQSAAAGHVGTGGLAMIHTVGLSWAPVLDVLTIPFGIAVFAIVWMASHAINVLILLSPWGAVDAGLKAARTGLLGLVTLTATINPWLGALLSIVVIIFAYLIAGWAFRLTIFGSVMCWDFFTARRHRFTVLDDGNKMFAGSGFSGVPVRTYGKLLRRADGSLEFAYRPWLVMQPRAVAVPVPASSALVGAGLVFSVVVREAGGTLFLLPMRYRGHEEQLSACYHLGGVQPAGLRKAWSSLKELIGGKAAARPAPAAA